MTSRRPERNTNRLWREARRRSVDVLEPSVQDKLTLRSQGVLRETLEDDGGFLELALPIAADDTRCHKFPLELAKGLCGLIPEGQ